MTVEDALRGERLGDVDLSQPQCVPTGCSVEETLRVMRSSGIGAILICDGERLAGIFTERDALNKLFDARIDVRQPIDRLMTRDPRVLTLDDTLGDAVQLMTEHGYRHIPLTDRDGRRAGMIAAPDIVRWIAEHFPAEVVNLPPRVHQEFTAPEGA